MDNFLIVDKSVDNMWKEIFNSRVAVSARVAYVAAMGPGGFESVW